MSNNCLQTKLKGVVNNDSLRKIGEFRFKISGEHRLQIGTTEYPVTTEMSILDTYPTVVFTDNNERSIEIDHFARVRRTSADCEISVKDKYKIQEFMADGNTPIECNIDELKYSPLTQLYMYSGVDGSTGKITGHVSNLPTTLTELELFSKSIVVDAFPVLPSLTTIDLKLSEAIDINTIVNNCPALDKVYEFYQGLKGNINTLPTRTGVTMLCLEQRGSAPSEITGDIVSLASWTGLETLKISGTKISGSIAAFLDAMYNAGRTSGSITITVNSVVTNVSGASSTQTYNFSSGGWTMA